MTGSSAVIARKLAAGYAELPKLTGTFVSNPPELPDLSKMDLFNTNLHNSITTIYHDLALDSDHKCRNVKETQSPKRQRASHAKAVVFAKSAAMAASQSVVSASPMERRAIMTGHLP